MLDAILSHPHPPQPRSSPVLSSPCLSPTSIPIDLMSSSLGIQGREPLRLSAGPSTDRTHHQRRGDGRRTWGREHPCCVGWPRRRRGSRGGRRCPAARVPPANDKSRPQGAVARHRETRACRLDTPPPAWFPRPELVGARDPRDAASCPNHPTPGSRNVRRCAEEERHPEQAEDPEHSSPDWFPTGVQDQVVHRIRGSADWSMISIDERCVLSVWTGCIILAREPHRTR